MPIYEYRCPDCGHKFEVLQKFSDGPVKLCPSCGKEEVKKLISTTSFVLKGAGWYKDHYGLKNNTSAGESGASGGDSAAPGAGAATPPAAAPSTSPAPAAASSGTASSGGSSASPSSSGGSSTAASG